MSEFQLNGDTCSDVEIFSDPVEKFRTEQCPAFGSPCLSPQAHWHGCGSFSSVARSVSFDRLGWVCNIPMTQNHHLKKTCYQIQKLQESTFNQTQWSTYNWIMLMALTGPVWATMFHQAVPLAEMKLHAWESLTKVWKLPTAKSVRSRASHGPMLNGYSQASLVFLAWSMGGPCLQELVLSSHWQWWGAYHFHVFEWEDTFR